MRSKTLFLLFSVALALPAAEPAEAARLKKFNDAKFGMFIHWGPYSLASVEASWPIMVPGKWGISEADYRALPQRFNPVQFDPQAWVRLAKEAGQRYIVFTSKHHDGFAMFDSQYTDYKITKTPYGKDTAKMLADAAKAEGIPFGFYYSPPDMNHPGFRDTTKLSSTNWRSEPQRPEWPLYLDYMELQLTELLTRYGDLFVIWFDGLANQQVYNGRRFHKLIREIQPGALINNRIGLTGDYVTPEQRLPKGIPTKGAAVGNTDPNDKGLANAAPAPEQFQPWETCMTINGTWAYNKNDTRYKSSTELVRALVDAASKGGNFLLNVGPTPEGTIQPEFQQRLRAIGAWLKVNGDAIYGTTYGPVQGLQWGRTTTKGKTVYLHVFDPPAALELPNWKAKVVRVRALNGGQALKFTEQAGKLKIDPAGLPADPHAAVIAIETR
ncbi:MAG: alpha-L-fucosidase [Acidobacteria bacterium]|nr:alpha-L-fucosidase [Acidobacteriota bacterium]